MWATVLLAFHWHLSNPNKSAQKSQTIVTCLACGCCNMAVSTACSSPLFLDGQMWHLQHFCGSSSADAVSGKRQTFRASVNCWKSWHFFPFLGHGQNSWKPNCLACEIFLLPKLEIWKTICMFIAVR